MIKKVIAIIAIVFLNCATRFVLVHEVPKSPTFIVIPLGFAEKDISFVNLISEAFITNGARVIERPVMLKKHTETEKSSEAGGAVWVPGSGIGIGGGTQKGKETAREISDPVGILEFTDADYVVYVQERDKWIRIVKRENKQLIFVGQLPDPQSESPAKFIRGLLSKIGAL